MNKGVITMFRRKSVLEVPAIQDAVKKFWSKEKHTREEKLEMRQILRDAQTLFKNMEGYIEQDCIPKDSAMD
jgi:hypothetical protein